MKNEVKHTAHSNYRCEYHVVFAPKYRREAEACVDHIHMLMDIPLHLRIAQFMGMFR